MDVGFVGLGGMGSAMAARLLAAGHQVRVWNRTPERAAELARRGARLAGHPAQALEGEAFISMLADDAAVREVFLESEVLQGLAHRPTHLCMSTLSVAFAAELARFHGAAGIPYLAAPVLGRPDIAAEGKLHILVAGDAASIERVRPLLEALGQRTWPLGEQPERANALKLLGNFLIAAAIEGMGEAMALGRRQGLTESSVFEVLTGTLFGSPVYKDYGEMIAAHRFEPAAFRLALGLKDLRLVLAAAEAVNVPLPLASTLHDNLLDAAAHGDLDKDWAALSQVSFRRADLAH